MANRSSTVSARLAGAWASPAAAESASAASTGSHEIRTNMSAPPQLSSHLLRCFAPSARRPSMARDRRIQLLLSIFDQAFGGASWHGTPLGGALRGVSLRQALWRPRPRRPNLPEPVPPTAYW